MTRSRVELADLRTMGDEIRRRSFAFNRRPGERNNRGRISVGNVAGGPAPPAATPLSVATANGVSLSSWHRSDLGVLPAGTLLQASGALTPSVLLEGSIAAVKGLRVRVNDTTGGTLSGQAKYDYSDDGGSTWIETGVLTSQSRRALIGSMAGAFLTFPAGTYNNAAVYNSVVDGWEDQTGNGHDFIAVDDVHTMLLESSGSYTGIPSLRTNGTDQWLQNMSLGPTLSGSDVAFTIWTVLQNMNTAQSGVPWNLGRQGQNARSFHEMQFSSGGTCNVNRIDDAAALKTRITPVGTNDGLRHRQCQAFSGTDVAVYQDGGSALTLTSSADLNVGTITFTWFTLGCRYGTSPSTYQACRYNEIITMPGVASTQMRADIEAYMAARYV